MNPGAWGLLALTAVIAVVDWVAVATERRSVEYFAKPATMVALIATVVALHPHDPTARTWFVIALVCSMAGDVFLMLPQDLFIPGLVSFLLGHIAYVIGLQEAHRSWPLAGVGIVLVALLVSLVLPRLLPGARREAPQLVPPVIVYVCVISLMVVSAWGSAVALAIGGAAFFYASDATLAWNRFVHEYPRGRLAVMITYHLGQIGLALSLVALR
jgi:uncharacterized membrane protein YhhN